MLGSFGISLATFGPARPAAAAIAAAATPAAAAGVGAAESSSPLRPTTTVGDCPGDERLDDAPTADF